MERNLGRQDEDGLHGLTSRERIRYRTMRPRNTASVWLSKSGELMPVEGQVMSGKSPPLGTTVLKSDWEMGCAQGVRRLLSQDPPAPLASSPVMLSTSTCHL